MGIFNPFQFVVVVVAAAPVYRAGLWVRLWA